MDTCFTHREMVRPGASLADNAATDARARPFGFDSHPNYTAGIVGQHSCVSPAFDPALDRRFDPVAAAGFLG